MAEIIPAIIGETAEEVKEKIEKVKEYVDWVQVDIVDGKFAEPESFGVAVSDHLHLWEGTDLPKIELHFMVQKPNVYVDDWVTSADRVLIHVESEGDIMSMLKRIKAANAEAGLVLKADTDIKEIEPYKDHIDVVQLMSIETIGNYGAPFDEKVYERIKKLKATYPDVTIEVDGGVSSDNAQKLIDSGATNLVVGSAIFTSGNIPEAIATLKNVG